MNFITNQIEWVKSFLSESTDGKASSRRLIEIGVSWTFIFSYIRVALSTQSMPALDMGWVVMLCGILGIKTASDYFNKEKVNGETK
jgi:hypothetical protein